MRRALGVAVALIALAVRASALDDHGIPPWQQLEGWNLGVLAVDPKAAATIYAWRDNSLQRSQDGGESWTLVTKTFSSISHFAIDPAKSDVLYAAATSAKTAQPGFFKSTDAGATWLEGGVGLKGKPVNALAIDPKSTQTIYLGTYRGGGVQKTTDGGRRWSECGKGLPKDASVIALAIDPASPRTLYAATDASLFKSTDGGASWTESSKGIEDKMKSHAVRSIATDRQTTTTLYAAHVSAGIFKSTDGGKSWFEANAGLLANMYHRMTLAADPKTASVVWAGDDNGVVYKSVDAAQTWSVVAKGIARPARILVAPSSPRTVYVCGEPWSFVTLTGGEPVERLRFDAGGLGKLSSGVCVAFSPDGKLIATGGGDGVVKLWDAASGKEVRALTPHKGRVPCVAFSPDSKRLYSEGTEYDDVARVSDVETGAVARDLPRGQCSNNAFAAFSPDGKTLAIFSCAKSGKVEGVALVDAESGARLALLDTPNFGYAVAFSPDGKNVAVATGKGTVRVHAVAGGALIGEFGPGHRGQAMAIAFSRDGALIATGGVDQSVKLWDVATGKLARSFDDERAMHDPVIAVAFHPDGKRLVAVSAQKICVYDHASGARLRKLGAGLGGIIAAALSPDGATIALALQSKEGAVLLVPTPEQLGPAGAIPAEPIVKNPPTPSPSSPPPSPPPGRRVEHEDKPPTVYGRPIKPQPSPSSPAPPAANEKKLEGHDGYITALAFSRDERLLASSAKDKTVRIWDVAGGKQLQKLAGRADSQMPLAFSPDAKLLATAADDSALTIFDVATGAVVKKIELDVFGYVSQAAFSADGKTLAFLSPRKSAHVVEVGSWKKTCDVETDSFCLDLSPDGARIALGWKVSGVRLVDVATGKDAVTALPLRGMAGAAMIAFAPDGKRLAVACAHDDPSVHVLDAATLGEVASFGESFEGLQAIAWARDGKTLATLGDLRMDPVVKLWDVAGGRRLGALEGKRVSAIALAREGKSLAVGSDDKTIRLIDLGERPK